jgi:hypothetical protein
MAARLLLDENLSERLLPLLTNIFPGSTHIRTSVAAAPPTLPCGTWPATAGFYW